MLSSSSSDRTFDFRGLSTDEKPLVYHDVPINNGSQFLEMDTGDIYLFDEEN